MRGTTVLCGVVAAMALSGCVASDAGDGAEYRLMGWFNDWNDDIEADFRAMVARYGDPLLMESFPPGFSLSPLSLEKCTELRSALQAKDYFASVGECTRQGPVATDGDQET